ncbi:MAG TPA: carbon storage regulator CsrA [Spirochaetia bacterium]|nr:carbon storage regulator CsrA [Spirochaetia bacterium]
MLVLARRINERIIIGDGIYVSVVDIKGDQVKLGIEAPPQVKVYRQEIFDAIQEENRKAAQSHGELPSLNGFIDEGSRGSSKEDR